jgi:hypothetical protein
MTKQDDRTNTRQSMPPAAARAELMLEFMAAELKRTGRVQDDDADHVEAAFARWLATKAR